MHATLPLPKATDSPAIRRRAVETLQVNIVHDDAWSLPGWCFAHGALHDPAHEVQLGAAFELGAVDGYAGSHTCAPAPRVAPHGFVINNGAAGMANFAGDAGGLLTRIAERPLPRALEAMRALGLHERGVRIDALRIRFDVDCLIERFDAIWPAGPAAAVSCRHRIVDGPALSVDHALGREAVAWAV